MRNASVIARRELVSAFTSPLAYISGTIFLMLVGILFVVDFQPGKEASLRPLFMSVVWVLVLAVPLLTMPLLSEEYARGTIETLMTAPVTEVGVVLGKFLGVLGFYMALLATTLPHLILLMVYGEPETGQTLMGYTGMLLVGAMFISIGLFFSSLTRHQLLAAASSAGALAALTLLPLLLHRLVGGLWRRVIDYVSVSARFEVFAQGKMDTRSVVFFLSVTALFLFVTVKVVESRRWR